jgi:hypothetical protein
MPLKPIFLLLSGFEWMRASNEGCDDSRQFGRLAFARPDATLARIASGL